MAYRWKGLRIDGVGFYIIFTYWLELIVCNKKQIISVIFFDAETCSRLQLLLLLMLVVRLSPYDLTFEMFQIESFYSNHSCPKVVQSLMLLLWRSFTHYVTMYYTMKNNLSFSIHFCQNVSHQKYKFHAIIGLFCSLFLTPVFDGI